jgi:hypothetical protein
MPILLRQKNINHNFFDVIHIIKQFSTVRSGYSLSLLIDINPCPVHALHRAIAATLTNARTRHNSRTRENQQVLSPIIANQLMSSYCAHSHWSSSNQAHQD